MHLYALLLVIKSQKVGENVTYFSPSLCYWHKEKDEKCFREDDCLEQAKAAGLATIDQLDIVVLCPIISEAGADALGNTEHPEKFPPCPDTF
jgi:hypothetical protein